VFQELVEATRLAEEANLSFAGDGSNSRARHLAEQLRVFLSPGPDKHIGSLL